MQVDTNVSESDIGGIKNDDKALFTIDAFPKRTFDGTVSQVRQSPQNIQNVVTYDVVVSVDNTDLALKPGMTAATRIVTDQRRDVLRVPSQALRFSPAGVDSIARPASKPTKKTAAVNGEGTPAAVWVLKDDKPVRIPVVAGLDDDTFAEILQGDLKADDPVILSEQRNGTKPAGAGSNGPRLRF
jgi:HlyD family secretion protein